MQTEKVTSLQQEIAKQRREVDNLEKEYPMGLENLFGCFKEMENAKGGLNLVQSVNELLPNTCTIIANLLDEITNQVETVKAVKIPAENDKQVLMDLEVYMSDYWKNNRRELFNNAAKEFSEDDDYT